jgi:hypothetical protein
VESSLFNTHIRSCHKKHVEDTGDMWCDYESSRTQRNLRLGAGVRAGMGGKSQKSRIRPLGGAWTGR